MTHLLAIDIGTSSVKAVVTDQAGVPRGIGTAEYPMLTPQPGWATQRPETWWQAAVDAVRQAVQAAGGDIGAVGLSGQMHGAVLLDGAGAPVDDAIIWADQRSAAETGQIAHLLGEDAMRRTGTLPATGFAASTLLWLKAHQPAVLDRARHCVQPKDYVRFRLTGEIACEVTDASATGLFDIARRGWAHDLIGQLGLPASLFSPPHEAAGTAGKLSAAAAASLGLRVGIPVAYGCADQAAQAVGNGLTEPGRMSVTLGSGGQVFVPLAAPETDPHLRVHTFCHAPDNRWYMLGAMLTAGLALRWLRNTLGMAGDPDAYPRLSALAAQVPPGADGLLFLPYLAGERAPLMNPHVRGAFVGLAIHHGPEHLARAVMEGVAFALRHILETMAASAALPGMTLASGNGLGSPVWCGIAADVLGRPLSFQPAGERAGAGAALIAGIGAGMYGGYADLARLTDQPVQVTEPGPDAQAYDALYARFLAASAHAAAQ